LKVLVYKNEEIKTIGLIFDIDKSTFSRKHMGSRYGFINMGYEHEVGLPNTANKLKIIYQVCKNISVLQTILI